MPLHFKLSDLNERLRKQAEAQLSRKGGTRPSSDGPEPRAKSTACGKADGTGPVSAETAAKRSDPSRIGLVPYCPKKISRPATREHSGTPNKTEAEYNAKILGGAGRFEPVTLRMPGGNYTPDWMTVDDGVVTFHEVKGSYRFGSESRAVLGFRTAAAMFPFFRFVWAKKQKGGQWTIKRAFEAEPNDTEAFKDFEEQQETK